MRQTRGRKSYGNSNPGRFLPEKDPWCNPEMPQMLQAISSQSHKRIINYVSYIVQPPDTLPQAVKQAGKEPASTPEGGENEDFRVRA